MEPSDHAANCPLCGRIITADQRICACGAVVTSEKEAGFRDYGLFLPWFGLAGFLITVWWIISPGMLYYTKMPILKLYGCVAVLSAVCAMLVAQKNEQDDTDINLSPANWFAFLVVLWPVAMPLFLFAHYKQSDEKRMKFGWITTGLFLSALLVLWLVVRRAPTTWPGNLDIEEPTATKRVESNKNSNNNNYNNNYAPPAPASDTQKPPASPPPPVQSVAPVQSAKSPTTQPGSRVPVPPAPSNITPSQKPQTSKNNAPDRSQSFGVALPPIP